MKIAECMSADVATITPEQSIQEAAEIMLEADVGAIPVMDGDQLSGVITDRDIAVRAVAEGLGPDTPVSEVMSDEVLSVYDDQEVEEAAILMSDRQVRRLIVMSREDETLAGVIALADIVRSSDADSAQVALDGVTDAGGEHNQSQDD